MNLSIVGAAVGLSFGGPIGMVGGALVPWALAMLAANREPEAPRRLVLILLLVELRSGNSVLAALQEVGRLIPEYPEIGRISRVAAISGLTRAIPEAGPELRPLVAQLARAQRSGASLTAVLRGVLDRDLATERAQRLARARALPVRLMIPITLLVLPGLVLLLYAPSLLGLLNDLTGTWS